MMDDDELLACYERVGALRAFVRKPRLLDSGNELRFFIPNDSPDHDLALMLGRQTYHDNEVLITVHLLKDATGKDLKKAAPARGGEKPYGHLAQMLYQRGFFNSGPVQRSIGEPVGTSSGQSAYGAALAAHLGYESMGHVPPGVLIEWAAGHSLRWMLPRDYFEEAGVQPED